MVSCRSFRKWDMFILLACKISALSGGTNWLAMGFATQPLTNNFLCRRKLRSGIDARPRKRHRNSGLWFAGRLGNSRPNSSDVWNHHQCVHSRSGYNHWNWRGQCRLDRSGSYTNGVQVDAYRSCNGNPTMIQYVGIGADAAHRGFSTIHFDGCPDAPGSANDCRTTPE